MCIKQREPAKNVLKKWKSIIDFFVSPNVVLHDGNGRIARLWHTTLLSKWEPIFEYIPLESQIEKFQDDYYSVIAKCHVLGESTLLNLC